MWRDGSGGVFVKEMGCFVVNDCAVRQVGDVCGMAQLAHRARDHAGGVEGNVQGFGGACVAKCGAERLILFVSAQGAGAMAGRKGDGFVEKKQFGVVIGLHDGPVPVFVPKHASDPCLVTPASRTETLVVVVENAAVAHEQSTGGSGDDVAAGKDAVLQWHGRELSVN